MLSHMGKWLSSAVPVAHLYCAKRNCKIGSILEFGIATRGKFAIVSYPRWFFLYFRLMVGMSFIVSVKSSFYLFSVSGVFFYFFFFFL